MRSGWRELWLASYGQQTIGRNTLVGHDAEEFAGGHAGVIHQHLEIARSGKAMAQLPGVDGRHGHAEIPSDLLEREIMLQAPGSEGRGKTEADVAPEALLLRHGWSVTGILTLSKA